MNCQDCGVSIESFTRRKFCSACIRQHKKERTRKSAQVRRALEKNGFLIAEKPRKKPKDDPWKILPPDAFAY